MRFFHSTRFRPFVWYLTVLFTIFSIPHFELITFELVGLVNSTAFAMEEYQEEHGNADTGAADGAIVKPHPDAPANPDHKQDKNENAPLIFLEKSGSPEVTAGSVADIPETMQFTGAASYRVPIDLPPGRAGIAPNLAITYSSYLGNGFSGLGWSIDLGAIQRSTKRAVNYDAKDFVVSMGGSQADLIAKPGWGADYYGNKTDETLLKYHYNPSTRGWEVTSKDGHKYYYGTTVASRQDFDQGNKIFKWCLDKVVDPNGNYMTIAYTKDQGAIYPESIRYTGNSGIDPAYEVRFLREDRTDHYPLYTTNFGVDEVYRLKEIHLIGKHGDLIRKYVLRYDYSTVTSRSLLKSMTQCGSDGRSALPPTVFTWKTGGKQGERQQISVGERYGNRLGATALFGDFNGDGMTDILNMWGLSVWLSRGDGTFKGGYKLPDQLPLSSPYVGDFNGDGKAEIVASSGMSGFMCFLTDTGGFTTLKLRAGGGPNVFASGSFRGDSRANVISLVERWRQPFYDVYINTFTGDGIYDNLWSAGGLRTRGAIATGDFNGDGRMDIAQIIEAGAILVLLSQGGSFSGSYWGENGHFSYTGFQVGDFNGDGKSDVIQFLSGVAYVSLSTGNNSFSTAAWGNDSEFQADNRIHVLDLNQDGKADLLYLDDAGSAYAWLSNGKGFDGPVLWSSGHSDRVLEFGDFNGDGKPDILQGDKHANAYVWLSQEEPPDLLSTITSPAGGVSEIKYKPSSRYQNSYLPMILQTVESITTDDGRGNTSNVSYSYEGGLYDAAERDFRGFRKVTASTSEATVETLFHQDAVKHGKVEKVTTVSQDGHIRTIENTYDTRDLDGEAKFPALVSTTTTVTDAGAAPFTLTNTLEYDSYLNIKSNTTSGTDSETVTIGTEYAQFERPWIMAKPKMVTVKNAAGEIMNRKWMDYDPVTGNLEREEVCKCDNPATDCLKRNSAQNPQITYTYYAEGNVHTITDPLGNVTTFTYDAETKTHVHEKTNTLGHKTTTVYENGRIVSMTPPHLQGTKHVFIYTYDSLGRKDMQYRPDGGWTKYDYKNLGSPAEQYVVQQEHIAGGREGYPDTFSRSYFDGLGRTYKSEFSAAGSKKIIAETIFDNMGRVRQKSSPFFEGDPQYYTTFIYDGFSRPLTVTAPDNSVVSTTYGGLTRTVTNQRGHSTTSTHDIYQRLRSVQDAKGTITRYTYDVLGNLVEVIAAEGLPEQNITTITYGSLSRKRSMSDPDMGRWSYDYDKAGNLTSQTDAKGQTTKFEYDSLGRIKCKKAVVAQSDRQESPIPSVSGPFPSWPRGLAPDVSRYKVNYEYDDPNVPYSQGQLTRVTTYEDKTKTGFDSTEEFDIMQRPTKVKKQVGNQSRTTYKSYDSAGRLASLRYHNVIYNRHINLFYHYDTLGNLATIHSDSLSLAPTVVEYSDFTALGQARTTTFPGVVTTREFDPQTARLHTLQSIDRSSGKEVQNLTYNYDPAGNIEQTTDLYHPKARLRDDLYTPTEPRTQIFGYDEINRLTNADGESYRYDVLGNIISKPVLSGGKYGTNTYVYDYSRRPHAVIQAGHRSYEYDENGNLRFRSDSGSSNSLRIQYTPDNKPKVIKGLGHILVFSYDGYGRRIKKDGLGAALYFGELYEQKEGEDSIHIYGAGGRIATVTSSGITYYHPDHLGSTAFTTSSDFEFSSATVVSNILSYDPFGAVLNGSSRPYSSVKYTFTGQEEDRELGLYNYNARLYDPELGRFISPDTIVTAPGNLQSLNRYSYCLNNPLIYTDPSGHIFLFVGMMIGALVAGIQSNWNMQAMLMGGVIGAVSAGVYSLAEGTAAVALTGAVQAGAISGAAGGAAAGATAGYLGAAMTGGDVGQGILKGAWLGALGGAAFGAIGAPTSPVKVGAYALTGGGLSALGGGSFGEGALMAGGLALMTYGYYSFTNGRLPKGELSDGTAMVKDEKSEAAMKEISDNPNVSHMGKTAHKLDDLYKGKYEGNPYFRWITSHVPMSNDGSVLHDFGGYRIFDKFWNPVTNYGSMIPSAALTVGAVAGYYMPFTWSVKGGLSEQ